MPWLAMGQEGCAGAWPPSQQGARPSVGSRSLVARSHRLLSILMVGQATSPVDVRGTTAVTQRHSWAVGSPITPALAAPRLDKVSIPPVASDNA